MRESRWLRWLGPGVVALWAAGVVASATAGAGDRAWVARACPGGADDLVASGHAVASSPRASARGAPWYRLDPDLGPDGSLRGQRLSLGIVGESLVQTASLPPESFAAGPFGRLILVGSDDGRESRLEALDVAAGCTSLIATSPDVIRRATLDPIGTGLLEMRVSRVGRADLGVWHRMVQGSTAPRRVLPPPVPDERFGRTFSTEFVRDAAARRVAVQSCGEIACRTRLLDAKGEPVGSIADPGLGSLMGLDGDRVVTYAACRGLPCPIIATDVGSGARRVLVVDGGPAVIVSAPNGSRLVDQVDAGGEQRLRSTGLVDGDVADLGPAPTGLQLLAGADRAASGSRIPDGWVVLAPDGRLPADPSTPRPLLRHVPDGLTVPIDEALR